MILPPRRPYSSDEQVGGHVPLLLPILAKENPRVFGDMAELLPWHRGHPARTHEVMKANLECMGIGHLLKMIG